MPKTFTLNIPISKIDEEQRIVTGVASSEALDSQGDIVDYEASKKAFTDWIGIGNIREMHNPIAIGKGIDVQFDDANKSIILNSKISESSDGQNAWTKVKEGILAGYSIGGQIFKVTKDKAVEGATRIVDYALSEVSLVDNPANPDAQLIMVKSKGGKPQVTKAGIAVLDGDARDHTAASVATVINGAAPKVGGTAVPKKVVGVDGKSFTNKSDGADMKKSVWDAQTAISLASELTWLILNESYGGDEGQVSDLMTAFNALRDFAAKEVAEGDDFDMWQSDSVEVIELARNAINLRKGIVMAEEKKIEKTTNVVGGVERDEKATVVADERPTNVVETETTDEKAAEVVADETVATEGEEVVTEEAAPVVATKEDGKTEEKSDTASDLVKTVQSLMAKLNDGQGADLKKVADLVSDLSGKVEKSMTALEDRIKTLESQPAETKAKASYIVEKDGSKPIDTDTEVLLKRQDYLAEHPEDAKPGEMQQIFTDIRKAKLSEPLSLNS